MEDRSGQVMAVAILFLILSWVTVGLRCYVRSVTFPNFYDSLLMIIRTCIIKGFGLDDQLMVATLLFFTAYLACQMGGAVHGTGRHREVLTDESAQRALHFWYFCEIFYTISTCLLKIAVGFFLLRITVHRYHILLIQLIMVVAGFLGIG